MSVSVSAVIPCHNVSEYVSDAIESVIRQTYPVEQIVCVDDGSTDDTLRILRNYEAIYDSVVVLTGPKRGGNNARNIGLDYIASDYVQFMDADDVLDEDKISSQLAAIEKTCAPVDLVAGAYRYGYCDNDDVDILVPGIKTDLVNLARVELGRTSANLWRRSSLKVVGGWNKDWPDSQEYELMFRLISSGYSVSYHRDPKTWIRKRPGSVTANDNLERFVRMVRLRSMILEQARSERVTDQEVMQIQQALFMAIRLVGFRSISMAVDLHREYIKVDFRPKIGYFSRAYVIGYHLLGFERLEILRSFISRLRAPLVG